MAPTDDLRAGGPRTHEASPHREETARRLVRRVDEGEARFPAEGGRNVGAAYDGSNVLFRLLRLTTWGPGLMNLGYYFFRGPFAFLNLYVNLSRAQERLVFESLRLVDVPPGGRVLDVACGRGKSAFMTHCVHRDADVTGVDLLERNVEIARTLYGNVETLRYRVGSAMDLDSPDGSFDRVQCIEAAFHFPDRARFLREAHRVLRPGGKLVVVDLTWCRESMRQELNEKKVRALLDLWEFDDLWTAEEYRREGEAAGFTILASEDWTERVLRPFQGLFRAVLAIAGTRLGRKRLLQRNPLLAELTEEDWKELRWVAESHEYTQGQMRYTAVVMRKGAE